MNHSTNLETIYLAGGCFWCLEAIFTLFKGIEAVTPGYMGGKTANPTYDQVCTGLTLHAETVKIEFNPSVIALETILEIFFSSHNPTTINQQGADIGTQYRSAIFPTSPSQMRKAQEYIQRLSDQKVYSDPIVTEIHEASSFYTAEPYHHQYFLHHPLQPFCEMSIGPKIDKIKKKYNL